MYVASRKGLSDAKQGKLKDLIRVLSDLWPTSWGRPKIVHLDEQRTSYVPSDSMMPWYLTLETGKFWFRAEVYNCENGHVGFMLCNYDTELQYDSKTATFQARYPPHGRRVAMIESGVTWDRLRPADTLHHDLNISEYLHGLRPGDSIEIQWRRNKEFLYGWWYGVVGPLESFDGNSSFYHCHSNGRSVIDR